VIDVTVGRPSWTRVIPSVFPSLQPHYRAFIATTRQSAPLRRIGTFGLAVGGRLCLCPWHRRQGSHVLYQSLIRCLHAGCRSVGIRTSSELIPQEGSPAVLASSNPLSTLPKQFACACARLSRPCLSGSWSRRFRDAQDHGFWPRPLAVAWDRRPDHRTRKALLNLQYSCAAPCELAMLVTQDPERKGRKTLPNAPAVVTQSSAVNQENLAALRKGRHCKDASGHVRIDWGGRPPK
jgi:hypothetical protein